MRDAVIRYNAEGITGLRDRTTLGRRRCLSDTERASLRAMILHGPMIVGTGRANRLHPASVSRIVRRLDLLRQKTRPRHPPSDP
ncbi:MAG: hypothetical protein J0H14_16955 [Alphaproteobacteria bacterium]|nr:hypothetical protein [Alphaproteobacteria bacterium]